METVSYRRWCPSESPLRIEFPVDLLNGFQAASRSAQGVLLGTRHASDIRVLELRPDGIDLDPAGLPQVGIFVYRPRGEVFLAEADVERFQETAAEAALVVAGRRAGFFVRDSAGALRAIRSYEEFALAETAPAQPVAPLAPVKAPSVKPAPAPAARVAPRPAVAWNAAAASRPRAAGQRSARRLEWRWATLAAAIALGIPLGALAYLRPLLPAPLNLQFAERNGQVLLSWNPAAETDGGELEILDGGKRILAVLGPGQSHATYTVQTGDIIATLRANPDRGPVRSQSVRVFAQPAPQATAAAWDRTREGVEGLEHRAAGLRDALRDSRTRIDELNRRIRQLTAVR
jgi:hypothetical protein